jgi:hypothetical protein
MENHSVFLYSFLLGIFQESDIDGLLDSSILESITEEEKLKWNKKYNVSITQYLRDCMVNYVGKSLSDFLRLVELNVSKNFAT